MGMTGYHEPTQELTRETRSVHRALLTIMEELEAVDWYQQRVDAATDQALKEILAHNRDEEIEHAAMTLEWLRRHVPKVDEIFRTYLFTDAPIVDIEEESQANASDESGQLKKPETRTALPDKDLGIGDLGIGDLERGE